MRKRKIMVRFDDICPTMNFFQFERAMEIMRRYSVKPLLGVIPNCKDPELQIETIHEDFWEYLKDLQKYGCKLAMHGYTHRFDMNKRGNINRGFWSEFAGHTYKEQYRRISEGVEFLRKHGIETDIFFAPAHSYDNNTLKALSANGFHYMSDGKSSVPLYREGILCIPCKSGGCPKIKKYGYYTAVFHAHEWALPEKENGYKKFRELCMNYRNDIVGFDEFNDRSGRDCIWGKIEERLYVGYARNIKPLLSNIKHHILRKN